MGRGGILGEGLAGGGQGTGMRGKGKGTYVYAVLSSPSIPEKGDGNETSEEDHGGETHFGFEDAVVGFGHANHGCV